MAMAQGYMDIAQLLNQIKGVSGYENVSQSEGVVSASSAALSFCLLYISLCFCLYLSRSVCLSRSASLSPSVLFVCLFFVCFVFRFCFFLLVSLLSLSRSHSQPPFCFLSPVRSVFVSICLSLCLCLCLPPPLCLCKSNYQKQTLAEQPEESYRARYTALVSTLKTRSFC